MVAKVYIALSTFAQEGTAPLELLQQSGLIFDINTTGKRLSKEQVIACAQHYDGIVAGLEPYDQEVLESLHQLKCISRCGVGIDNINAKIARERNIQVLNTPDVVITPVAEMTLALIFDCLRHVTAQAAFMRQGKWERLVGSQLSGKTVGIIGLGRIGKRVAQLLTALGAKVLAYDIFQDQQWATQHQLTYVNLNDLLMSSDIVTLHLSGGSDQSFRLNAEHFKLIKKEAILINTSRGQFIHEGDLVEALNKGSLAGAALDVFEQEPYQGRLAQMPQVIVTPHCSTLTKESRLAMEMEAIGNIIKFFKQ